MKKLSWKTVDCTDYVLCKYLVKLDAVRAFSNLYFLVVLGKQAQVKGVGCSLPSDFQNGWITCTYRLNIHVLA